MGKLKMVSKFKAKLEDRIIEKLDKKGNFNIEYISKEAKSINLGLYGLNLLFAEPIDKLRLWVLTKFLGYKAFETRVTFL